MKNDGGSSTFSFLYNTTQNGLVYFCLVFQLIVEENVVKMSKECLLDVFVQL